MDCGSRCGHVLWDYEYGFEAEEGNLSYHIIYHILYHGIRLDDGHLRLDCTIMQYVLVLPSSVLSPRLGRHLQKLTESSRKIIKHLVVPLYSFRSDTKGGISKNDACMTNETNALPLPTSLPSLIIP
jgi:hypothetical protein